MKISFNFCLTVFVVVILFFLAGCSLLRTKDPNEPTDPLWVAHKTRLLEVQHWQSNGRFGARGDNNSWSGHFHWKRDKTDFFVNISAPLSGGSVALKGDNHRATIILDDKSSYSDLTANALLYRYTGLKLPVDELHYWLLGLPSPTTDIQQIQLDKQGKITKLTQKNWVLDFKRYQTVGQIQVPDKIFLENHEFDVRLSIQNWQID